VFIATTWLLQSRGLNLLVLTGKKSLSGTNIA
jgi:hypothetical protein